MYQVQSGDTLGGIALQFGVSVETIMQENGLVEAEKLGSGQTLFIPLPRKARRARAPPTCLWQP
jgi:LysM repeat protein